MAIPFRAHQGHSSCNHPSRAPKSRQTLPFEPWHLRETADGGAVTVQYARPSCSAPSSARPAQRHRLLPLQSTTQRAPPRVSTPAGSSGEGRPDQGLPRPACSIARSPAFPKGSRTMCRSTYRARVDAKTILTSSPARRLTAVSIRNPLPPPRASPHGKTKASSSSTRQCADRVQEFDLVRRPCTKNFVHMLELGGREANERSRRPLEFGQT